MRERGYICRAGGRRCPDAAHAVPESTTGHRLMATALTCHGREEQSCCSEEPYRLEIADRQ